MLPADSFEPTQKPRGARPDFVIDGYNYLHAIVLRGREREQFWAPSRQDELLERLSEVDAELLVFLDDTRGTDEEEAHARWSNLRLRRAPDADAAILAYFGRLPPDSRSASPCLVTADRSLADRCRSLGVQTMRPWDFEKSLTKRDAEGSIGVSSAD